MSYTHRYDAFMWSNLSVDTTQWEERKYLL